jgi:alkylation response protein AidB-like acyl-CoA dehydrogenase
MTFDLTPEQQSLVANARSATSLPAPAIDAVLVVEELAASDPSRGARFGFEGVGGKSNATAAMLPGLEGSESALASIPEANQIRARLIAAAVALGVGRAAIDHAIASMKKLGVKADPDQTAPHWALADGATEVAAARVLTYSAAQMLDRGENAEDAITRAQAFAADAAQQAVEAAIRVVGAVGYGKGSLLDRLLRDAQTLRVILK